MAPRAHGLEQIAFMTPAPAPAAQVDCACAEASGKPCDAWLQSIFKSKML